MTSHLEMARSVRAECARSYHEARRLHRPSADLLAKLQAATTLDLRLTVRARKPNLFDRVTALFRRVA